MENKILQTIKDLSIQVDSKIDDLSTQVENLSTKMDDRFETTEAIMKIGFDDVYVRPDKHEDNINELKHEVASVGDSTARIETKLDQEMAAVFSRFKRLEQPSGV